MSKIRDLAQIYGRHIGATWQKTVAGAQRVVMVIYPKDRERALRRHLGEFEQATKQGKHGWRLVDATPWFGEWMVGQEYKEAYFTEPELLEMSVAEEFRAYVAERLSTELDEADEQSVVALYGVGSLYGFLRISDLMPMVDQSIKGRLVIFFPGTKDEDNYRLLDARDGWNYLAQPITLNDSWTP